MSESAPRNTFDGDGSTLVFTYTFDVISLVTSIRVVLSDDDTALETQQVEGTHYTHNKDDKTVTFVAAPPIGQKTVIIYRATSRDRHVNYSSGSNLIERDLDEDPNRLTSVTQEIEGNLNDCMRLLPDGSAWNARGLEGRRAAPAEHGDSWTTYNQVVSMLAGLLTLETDTGDLIVHEGDGSAVNFPITGYRGVDALQLLVFVEGVIQQPGLTDDDYEVLTEDDTGYPGPDNGWDYLKFSGAPVDGAKIRIRVIKGIVVGYLGPGAVGGDEIGDDEIDLQHLNIGAGLDKRFLVFDEDGDPAGRIVTPDDISEFDEGVQANRLSDFAAPNDDISMGLNRIVSLGAGTGASHAVNKSQMEAYTDGRLRVQHQGVTDDLPIAASASFTDIADFSFNPDRITLCVKFRTGSGNGPSGTAFDYSATYCADFFESATKRAVAGPGFINNVQAPTLEFRLTGTTLAVRIVELGTHLEAWTQGRAVAEKFADASA